MIELNEETIGLIFLTTQLIGSFVVLGYILINSHLQNKKKIKELNEKKHR